MNKILRLIAIIGLASISCLTNLKATAAHDPNQLNPEHVRVVSSCPLDLRQDIIGGLMDRVQNENYGPFARYNTELYLGLFPRQLPQTVRTHFIPLDPAVWREDANLKAFPIRGSEKKLVNIPFLQWTLAECYNLLNYA